MKLLWSRISTSRTEGGGRIMKGACFVLESSGTFFWRIHHRVHEGLLNTLQSWGYNEIFGQRVWGPLFVFTGVAHGLKTLDLLVEILSANFLLPTLNGFQKQMSRTITYLPCFPFSMQCFRNSIFICYVKEERCFTEKWWLKRMIKWSLPRRCFFQKN